MKTIVLTGGGTAGHVMPNISLMPKIIKDFNRVVYIGSKNGIEKQIISDYNKITKSLQIEYYEVDTIKLRRSLSVKNLAIPFVLLKGMSQCKKLLKNIKPNVIFSKGGFVSVPVVLAANKLKISVVSHESDLTMGLANRLTKNKVQIICTTFPETALNYKNAICTGSPIRQQIYKGDKKNVVAKHNLNANKPTLVAMGGSLGAKNINTTMFECANDLTPNFNVIHLV
ncbi:MAG: glycosyltransferase, partial [Firmicutes bacterium]|nr:glycosyltransferase [Bacillota bacterium]